MPPSELIFFGVTLVYFGCAALKALNTHYLHLILKSQQSDAGGFITISQFYQWVNY